VAVASRRPTGSRLYETSKAHVGFTRPLKAKLIKVLTLDDEVADALKPSAVAALDAAVSHDLRIVLTFIKYAQHMADLSRSKGTKLIRLSNTHASDYHYGTSATGVLIRPVDENGIHRAVTDTRTSLSTVYSVAILAVGLSLNEAIR
jgi:hypothetical protein